MYINLCTAVNIRCKRVHNNTVNSKLDNIINSMPRCQSNRTKHSGIMDRKRSVDNLSPVLAESNEGSSNKKSNLVSDLDKTLVGPSTEPDLYDNDSSMSGIDTSVEKISATHSMREEIGSCLKEILFGQEFKSLLNEHFRQSMEPVLKEISVLKTDMMHVKVHQNKTDAEFFQFGVKLDIMEQHEKSTQLIIRNNWPETKDEDLVRLVLDYFNEVLDVDVYGASIVNCFRIGKSAKNQNLSRNNIAVGSQTSESGSRPIFVKFSSGILRDAVLRARSSLKKDVRTKDVYINEDLTAHRRTMLNDLRILKKEKQIQDCWSFHGKICYKTLQGKVVDATDQAREASTWKVSI